MTLLEALVIVAALHAELLGDLSDDEHEALTLVLAEASKAAQADKKAEQA